MESLILTFMIIISVMGFIGGNVIGFAAGKDVGRKQTFDEIKSFYDDAPNKHDP